MPENANTLLTTRAIINDEDRILLLRRSRHDSHNPGLWEFPGGKIDAGEEIADGLMREVHEETGLLIGELSNIAHIESELIRKGKYEGRLYLALFYAIQKIGGNLTLSDEHEATSWETLQGAEKLDLTHESRRALASFAIINS